MDKLKLLVITAEWEKRKTDIDSQTQEAVIGGADKKTVGAMKAYSKFFQIVIDDLTSLAL